MLKSIGLQLGFRTDPIFLMIKLIFHLQICLQQANKKVGGRSEYGNRTRLPGVGSPCTTDVLIPLVCIYNNSIIIKVAFVVSLLKSRYPDSNRGPTHYECVALPTEPYRQKRMQRYIQKRRNQNICRYFYLLLKQYSV